MSIRKIFEEELAELKTELVEMCRLTEQMIENAITALVNRDRELGKSIGQMDKRVDEYEMDIENYNKLINDLKNDIIDYQNGCDSCVTQTQIKLDNINFYKIYCFIVSILFIIAMVILIFF